MAIPSTTPTKVIALAADDFKRTGFPDGSLPAPAIAPEFTVSRNDTSITATITDPNGAVSYNVRVDEGTAVAGLTVSGLSPGTTYSFQVQGVNGEALSPWSAAVSVITTTSGESVIYQDSFSSGGFTGSIFQGSIPVNCTVSTQNPLSSTHSMRFEFIGSSSGTDAQAQRNFNLGALYKDVTVEFDLYIPDGAESYGGSAYTHRADSPSNNKVFRLWSDNGVNSGNNGYNSDEKVGASFTAGSGGNSDLAIEAAVGGFMTEVGSVSNFIGPSDLGAWMNIKMYFQLPTGSGTNDGVITVTKNDVEVASVAIGSWGADENHAFQFGYLMGYANSGFSSTTLIFMDNLRFVGEAV